MSTWGDPFAGCRHDQGGLIGRLLSVGLEVAKDFRKRPKFFARSQEFG
jgi:hypothetical protein